jgi:hypothetical protein
MERCFNWKIVFPETTDPFKEPEKLSITVTDDESASLNRFFQYWTDAAEYVNYLDKGQIESLCNIIQKKAFTGWYQGASTVVEHIKSLVAGLESIDVNVLTGSLLELKTKYQRSPVDFHVSFDKAVQVVYSYILANYKVRKREN